LSTKSKKCHLRIQRLLRRYGQGNSDKHMTTSVVKVGRQSRRIQWQSSANYRQGRITSNSGQRGSRKSPVAVARAVSSPIAVTGAVPSPVAVAGRVASPVSVGRRIAHGEFRLDDGEGSDGCDCDKGEKCEVAAEEHSGLRPHALSPVWFHRNRG
jgi:hypothetical protein